jgi:ATP-binding cassette subfamily B protein
MSFSERPVSPVRRLLPYFHRHRRSLALGFGCILATTAIQLLAPWVLKFAVDDLTSGVTRAKLLYYAGVLFAIALVGGVFRFLMRKVVIGVSRHMEYDLRNDFFRHLQRLPPAFYQERRTGDLMSRATNDLNAVRMMAGPSVMYATQTTLVFVVAIILMVSIDPWLTMVALLPLPFVSVSVKVFGTAIHRRFERIQEQLSELSAVAQENLSGVRVVRAYGQERAELAKFREANQEYVARNRGLIRLQGAFYPSLTLLLGLGALLVLWLGSREVIAGRITVGELVAFNAYLVMLAWPMIAFGWVTNMLQRGTASWKRMLELLDVPPAIADAARRWRWTCCDRRATRTAPPDLRLWRPPRSGRRRSVVEPGQTVAIVGATGSGKTTLLSVLPRLIDPPTGTVYLDGVDVRELPLATLRAAIGMAPQEPFLFSDTLEANIAFAPEIAALPAEARRRAVEQAAELARLDKDLRDFPQRLRHAGGGARHHAVWRSETADLSGARAGHRAPGADSRRRVVGGGHIYRRRNSPSPPRSAARPDLPNRVAPGLDRPRCRLHRRARRGTHRRARHSRRTSAARRPVCGVASSAVARR